MILNIIVAFFSSLLITAISYMDAEEQSSMVFIKNFVSGFVIIVVGSIFLTSFVGKDMSNMPVDSTIL